MPREISLSKPKTVPEADYKKQHPDLYAHLEKLNPLEQAVLQEVGRKLNYSVSMHLAMGALSQSAASNKRGDVEETINSLERKGMVRRYASHSYALSNTGLSIITALRTTGKEEGLKKLYGDAYRARGKVQAEA